MTIRPSRMSSAAWLIAAAGLAAIPAFAQPTDSPEVVHRATNSSNHADRDPASRLSLATERVAIFKDGYALVVKTATATADAHGRVFTEQVPDAAVLGCFWASTDRGRIVAMRAELVKDEFEERRETVALTLAEVLRVNTDRRVKLRLSSPAEEVVEGSIVRVLESEPAPAPPPPGSFPRGVGPDDGSSAGTVRTPMERAGGHYVVLDSEGVQRIVPIGNILSLGGRDLQTTVERPEKVVRATKRLSFDLGADAAGGPASLRIMYFTPGARWIPTYRLAVNPDNKSCELALQGELLNELEDFKGVALDMVVGVPNFRFRGTVSPLVMERTLHNALLAAAPDIMGRSQYSNALFAQRAGEWQSEQIREIPGADLAPELGAGGEQDLFVYSVPSFDLNRGERATLPVLSQQVTFDHLYTLDIAAVRDPRQSGTAQYQCKSPSEGGPPPSGESPTSRFDVNHIWHQIELKNGSGAPWTTGAALVMGASRDGAAGRTIPVAQELLRYTPAGGKVLLPLTIAVDLRAELQEEELSREENALRRNSTTYARVKARSTITLTSSRAESSTTRIKLALGGRVSSASDNGQVNITGHASADWGNNDPGPVNNHSDITWQIELKPGESKVLTVEFDYLTY